jgi:hypothetical protein
MTTRQGIEIPLHKSRIVLMLIGSFAFVAIGFWFVTAPPRIDNSYWGDPTKIAIAGYAAIVFFGFCAFIFTRKLFDLKPGLIIDDAGLNDNSGGLSAGHILWTDIENVSVVQIHKQKLLMLEVKNPQDYINSQTSLFKRKGMELNFKMYGTPLIITANGLKIPFEDLLALLTKGVEESRMKVLQPIAAIQSDQESPSGSGTSSFVSMQRARI